ncbi:MAG: TRAP transporter large permease subunit [Alphaproteobacteria bacterium]|nr:TRAP transporter large permease subunit [Alphaproteobacteria bacterium]
MDYVLTVMPIVLLLLGFPIFVILLATAAIVLIFFLNVPLTAGHQTMFGSIDKFALLAVPFFLFAAEVMGIGGMSRRIVAWVMALIGGVRGCRGLTTIGACTVFGAISGSSAATVAAVGGLLYPSLREKYNERFSTGLVASTGAIGVLIPPSISMILYGAAAEQSIAHLFVGGIFPGLLMGAFMAGYVLYYARKHDIRDGEPFNIKHLLATTRFGIWSLGGPPEPPRPQSAPSGRPGAITRLLGPPSARRRHGQRRAG